MSLRVATPADIEEIGKLLYLMHAEIGIGRVNEPKAREAVTNIVNNGSCILALRKDKIVGALGLVETSWWFGLDNFITDLFFFVDPAHRADINADGENAGHATRMISWAKHTVNLLSAKRGIVIPLILSVGTDVDPMPKIRFMRKHLQPFGGSFIHKPKAA